MKKYRGCLQENGRKARWEEEEIKERTWICFCPSLLLLLLLLLALDPWCSCAWVSLGAWLASGKSPAWRLLRPCAKSLDHLLRTCCLSYVWVAITSLQAFFPYYILADAPHRILLAFLLIKKSSNLT